MRLYDITCSDCGSKYRVAESDTAVGAPGLQKCSGCGAIVASWSDRKLKVFKLEMRPERRYPRVPVPPSP
jgi:DNA-directed RNA polymerase subunit RPC12/RpoP